MQLDSSSKDKCEKSKINLNPICILLACYNGEKFIEDQILSIINQTYSNWHLILRDDGSTDRTKDIIQHYKNMDKRITIVEDDIGNLGPSLNFGVLLQFAFEKNFEIFFFCDQDDIWSKDKLAIQLARFNSVERIYGRNIPIMVYSDLAVVDRDLDLIDISFMHYQGISNEDKRLSNLLLSQNIVTGCAAAINRKLASISLPFPTDILMHDWWIALCCSLNGLVKFISRPLVFYRQHGENEVGAKRLIDLINPFKTSLIDRWKAGTDHFLGTTVQASHLLKRIDAHNIHCDEIKLDAVRSYSNIGSMTSLRRLIVAKKKQFYRQGYLRNLLFIARLLFMR